MITPLGCWEQRFLGCEPVAHWLKTAVSDRWVRFHSLPESKRYPENEAEYATLLDRHNRMLGELTNAGRDAVLLTTGYSESPNPVRTHPELESLDPKALPWRSVPMHELDAGFTAPSYWHVFASVWVWCPGLFDPIIRLVADEVLANIMIVNPECHWLLHPYDGGMDVIAESSEARDRLKSSYSDWLSPRSDGL
jgi:hypothetical protein